MLDNLLDFLEKIIINLLKIIVKLIKNIILFSFKQIIIFIKFLSKKIMTKLNIPKEKIKDYYDKYIIRYIDIFRNKKKLIFRFAMIIVLIITVSSSILVGPNIARHYKATNNSLSFVEYNTHIEKSNEENNNANVTQINNEPAPAPEPEPEPASAPAPDTSYRWPTESNYYITTYFSRAHDGIDIAGCGYNSNIYAIYSGEVVTSSFTSTNGNYIIIKDDKGVYSMYAHLANKYVWAGQRVEKGQVIGGMGATGFATGTHLHFSTWYGYPYYGGTAFNPYSIY